MGKQTHKVNRLSEALVKSGTANFANPAMALKMMLAVFKQQANDPMAQDFSKLALVNHSLLLQRYVHLWAEHEQVQPLERLSATEQRFADLLDTALQQLVPQMLVGYRSCLSAFDNLMNQPLSESAEIARRHLLKPTSVRFALWYLNHLTTLTLEHDAAV